MKIRNYVTDTILVSDAVINKNINSKINYTGKRFSFSHKFTFIFIKCYLMINLLFASSIYWGKFLLEG